ncbi:hypothetical protein EVAR_68517_1 [Eumeta japonica]|uniref:Uncharacterized protein n=1 Tax=Eumeta variegata TaxID=151549 RepID=A0A4C1ZE39_EUMVA|nr:hypothetical protein EVAR_68517_1 [Eumeta japonica]
MVTAAHGHSQPQKSHQWVAGLSERIRIFDGGGSDEEEIDDHGQPIEAGRPSGGCARAGGRELGRALGASPVTKAPATSSITYPMSHTGR